MYKLTKAQAQTIVDRMMKDIPYNLNIMNHTGIIIGSGNPKRIGSVHHGAVKAIQQGHTIEIYEDEEFVKKGINVPIDLNGEIVGVVGISGEVAETRPFGNLLKSAVILLINQSIASEKETSKHGLKQDFFHLMINTDIHYTNEFIHRALQYEIELTKPSQVLYVDSPTKISEYVTNCVSTFKISAYSLCVVIQDDNQLNSIIQAIRMKNTKAFLSVSKWNDTIAEGFLQAKSAMRILKGLNMDERLIYYSNCELTADMLTSLKSSTQIDHASQLLKLDEEMINTLQIYLNCNLNLNETASQLMIHRNTLSYRLNKIHSITGKDPKNLLDRIELIFMLIHHMKSRGGSD
ncbi:CdaR family transcriptional regulator [Paenibacillus agricola]|uniref:Sugar diacid utilization regulator n=1 Tax=Paenibacillus agricola TaxID=2716264 RepID=A0ABX0J709_9BACL|nr:sugar diacid recognition domain-containing protein [Paenibacillus agricola]NHN32227.1 sugar diacid utilization regulator [Paenibacillus agricola]